MITLNIHGLEKDLKSSTIRPFYSLIGNEFYFIKEAMRLIKAQIIKSEEDLIFNFHQFYFSKDPKIIKESIETARTLPIFSKHRLIFLRDIDHMSEKNWEVFSLYFKNPTPSSTLVFISEKEDKNKALKRKLEKFFQKSEKLNSPKLKPCFLEAKKINETQIPSWIRWIAKKKQMTFDPQALSLMSQVLDPHLCLIEQELEKLKLNLDQKKISPKEVLKFLSFSKRENIFKLVHLIGGKKLKPSLKLLKKLLDYGEGAHLILSLIFRHMNILSGVQLGLKKNSSKTNLIQKLKIPSFVISSYMDQAHLWSEEQMAHAFQSLHETDKSLKLSLVPQRIAMENLLLKMLYS